MSLIRHTPTHKERNRGARETREKRKAKFKSGLMLKKYKNIGI